MLYCTDHHLFINVLPVIIIPPAKKKERKRNTRGLLNPYIMIC